MIKKILFGVCLFSFLYGLSGCGTEYGKWNRYSAVADLANPIVHQKRLAASSFAMYGAEDDMETLLPLLNDEDIVVRYHARNSLVSIFGQDAGYNPEKWKSIRYKASSKETKTAMTRQQERRDLEQGEGAYYSHRVWASKGDKKKKE